MVLESVQNEALVKALNRANARGLECHPRREVRKGANVAQWFEVASYSARGTYHNVRLTFTANGIDFCCDCQAGQVGHLCQHVAAALAANGYGPVEEPQPEPEPEPEPKPRSAALGLMADAGLLGDNFRRRLS